MAYVHKRCLLRWLTSAPEAVARGCDVCDAPWRADLVTRPRTRDFVVDLLFGARGDAACRRFLRHVATIPRTYVGGDGADGGLESAEAVAGNNNNNNNKENAGVGFPDDVLDDDDDEDEDQDEPPPGVADRGAGDHPELDGVRDATAHGGGGGRDDRDEPQNSNNNSEAFGLEDALEAIGLLAPAGGGIEELNAAAAAIVRLSLRIRTSRRTTTHHIPHHEEASDLPNVRASLAL